MAMANTPLGQTTAHKASDHNNNSMIIHTIDSDSEEVGVAGDCISERWQHNHSIRQNGAWVAHMSERSCPCSMPCLFVVPHRLWSFDGHDMLSTPTGRKHHNYMISDVNSGIQQGSLFVMHITSPPSDTASCCLCCRKVQMRSPCIAGACQGSTAVPPQVQSSTRRSPELHHAY